MDENRNENFTNYEPNFVMKDPEPIAENPSYVTADTVSGEELFGEDLYDESFFKKKGPTPQPTTPTEEEGLYRDPKTHEPVEYYCKLPEDIDKRRVIIVDPMLATGGSAVATVDSVKKRGAKEISLMFLIAAPEGIEALTSAHPDVDIYIAAKDQGLNENAYIVPGLGDAGDRIFGTK